jgi:hypothetical protein
MSERLFETVDDSVAPDGPCCVALSHDGAPWVAYSGAGRQPRVATREGADDWRIDELAAGGLVGGPFRVCLDIDSEGDPHVAYRDTEAELIYGVRKGGSWTFEKVPTRIGLATPGGATDYGLRLHFRPDSPKLQNTPHLVFRDLLTGSIGYARKVQLAGDPGPKFRLVEAAHAVSPIFEMGSSSMAFDEFAGAFRIVYVEDHSGQNLDPPALHRVWTKIILDPLEGTLGEPSQLAQGNFNVIRETTVTANVPNFCTAYHNSTDKKLIAHYRVLGLVDAVTEELADVSNAVCPSAATTSMGKYRVAFDDVDGLKLARQVTDAQWTIDVIDPAATTTACPSLVYEKIALDAHLGYTVGGTLKYVTWTEQP